MTEEQDGAAWVLLVEDEEDGAALVLLDLKLLRRFGFKVLEWLHAGGGGEAVRRVPMVVLTSSDQERDARRAYDLGANSYPVKPVGAPVLLQMARGAWTTTGSG